jgi:hypothetical protein
MTATPATGVAPEGARTVAVHLAALRECSDLIQFAVIVAVAFMRMMQMARDEVIGVIAMRNGFVAASVPMRVGGFVGSAVVLRRAAGGVRRADFDAVLIEVVAVLGVQMPVVNVVRMIAVPDRGMAAALSVNVSVRFVDIAGGLVHATMIRGIGIAGTGASGVS